MTQPRKKAIKKNEEIDNNDDQLNSLREEFQLDLTGNEEIPASKTILDENEDENLVRLDFAVNQSESTGDFDKKANSEPKDEKNSSGKTGISPKIFNQNTKMLDENLDSLEKTNFDHELIESKANETLESEKKLSKSNVKPKKSESKKTQKQIKQPEKIIDQSEKIVTQKLNDENDFLLGEFEDHIKDRSNETFIKEITESLENDEYLKIQKDLNDSNESKILPENTENIDYVAEIENEIENAENAINPFKDDADSELDTDFMSKLEELFPENYQPEGVTKPLSNIEEISDNENSLSKESWQNVIKATEELSSPEISSSYLLGQAPVKNDFDLPPLENEWDSTYPGSISEEFPKETESMQSDYLRSASGTSSSSDNEIDNADENDESVDVLRRSFIEEFEQTPWEPDAESSKDESWLQTKLSSIKNWISSLNAAEKILLAMSTIISFAVIVAIGLVVFNWQSNKVIESTPPEIIDSTGIDLVYPTGLQLPGGWFFFLQEGKLNNNKWDPQTAEWLPTSTIRRVVAIPWSRQAEAVVQTLKTGDELRLFMNNNDILNYYVENVTQVDRENVEILTDTEPSLAVILFKSDNSDRWVVIAKP